MFSNKFRPKLLESSLHDLILYCILCLCYPCICPFSFPEASFYFGIYWHNGGYYLRLNGASQLYSFCALLSFTGIKSPLLYEFSLPNVAILFYALQLFHLVNMVLPCTCQWDLEHLEMPQWFATSICPYKNKNLYMENISASLMVIPAKLLEETIVRSEPYINCYQASSNSPNFGS